MGYAAGYSNTSGAENSYLGAYSGYTNATGHRNSFLGFGSGYNNGGSDNTYLGYSAGQTHINYSNNAYVGAYAGSNGWGGSNNSVLGYQAGYNISGGNNNIYIGYKAGYNNLSESNSIIIGSDQNWAGSNTLNIGGVLYGDLSAKTIGISTRVPQAALDVVSTGTLSTQFAQIWRNSSKVIQASMSATGVMMADSFIGNGALLTNLNATFVSSVTVSNAQGIYANRHVLSGNIEISSAPAAQYGGIFISSHVYLPAGAKYYGDGSGLTGVTALSAVLKTGDTMTGQLTLSGSTLTVTGNAFSVGRSTFVVKNGNVGIGTASPAQKLSVAGTVESVAGGFKFPDGTTQTTAAGAATQWTTSGSNIYYSAGNVGISSAAPVAQLGVQGSAVISSTLTVQAIMPANFVGGFMYFISQSSNCPSGWLRADGTYKSPTDYLALFSMIEYMYGKSGTDFRLPDMTDGSFVRAIGGNAVGQGAKQEDAFQGHYHQVYGAGLNMWVVAPWWSSRSGDTDVSPGTAFARDVKPDGINGTPRITSETRPRNYAMIPCIKY